jgi:Kef-type K+ transport system membrane component KefB
MDLIGFCLTWRLFTVPKVFGIITRKFDMPQVVGACWAGLVLGPSVSGSFMRRPLWTKAEIGVIVLCFTAGLETDISHLKSPVGQR